MQTPKLSVLIVALNNKMHLPGCISSLYEKLGNSFSWEIIIINNDENLDVSSLPIDFSRIKIIDHKKNIGFGRGINLGAKEAQGEYLFILNADTEIQTENIQEVLAEFQKDEKVGAIGAGIVEKNGKVQEWSAGKELSLFDLILNNLGLSRSKKIWNSKKKIECDWVSGTAFFIKKELFQKLGGFDEKIFMYFEDMDLCKRTWGLGKKAVFFPEFRVLHIGGGSYQDRGLQKKHYYDSMEFYLKKHKNIFTQKTANFVRKVFIGK